MVKNLDLIDKKILSELDRDARIPLSKISKLIKKSKQLVCYRIKNLENEGIIKGYNAIVDYSKLGYISFRVYLKLKTINSSKQKELIDFLKSQNEIWWLMLIENNCDLGYAVLVKNIYDFYDHLNKLLEFNSLIKSKQIVVYSHIRCFSKSYLLLNIKFEEGMLVGASKPENLDAIDLKLLEIISKDGRISLVDLGDKLKMKPQSALYRLRILEKNQIIKGYSVNIDIEKLGFKNYKIYLSLLDNSKLKQIESFCQNNKFIVTTNKTIGGADFEIELQLPNINEFYKILDDIKEKFHDVIENIEFGIAKEEIKKTYFI